MKRRVTKSIVTPQNLIRSKQRKGKLKKSVKIRNKKPRENRLIFTGFWSRRRDLNPRPSRPERDALPAALRLERGKYSFFRKWSNMWSDQFFTGFLRNWNVEKVNVFKGFRRFRKFCRRERRLTPERCALPAALRLVTDFVFRNPQTLFFHSFNKRKYYNKYERKSQSFSHENKKLFLFLFQSV